MVKKGQMVSSGSGEGLIVSYCEQTIQSGLQTMKGIPQMVGLPASQEGPCSTKVV